MDRHQLIEVLAELEADKTQILPRGKNVQLACLFARWRHKKGTDNRPSAGILVNPRGASIYNCFTCGTSMPMERVVESLQRYRSDVDYTDLMRRVIEMETEALDTVLEGLPDYDSDVSGNQEHVFDEQLFAPFKGKAHKYLRERGLSIETIKKWDLGYDVDQRRVVFPVRSGQQNLVGMVGRHVLDGRPKYLNYWFFEKGMYLYGEHLALPRTIGIIVEGLMDVLKVDQALSEYGLDSKYRPYGLFGSSATRKQESKIVRLCDEAIVFLDNDNAGWEGTEKLLRNLQDKVMTKVVQYPEAVGGDPDTLTSQQIIDCIQGSSMGRISKKPNLT